MASLTLASDCGIEIEFVNIPLRSNSYHSKDDDDWEYNEFFLNLVSSYRWLNVISDPYLMMSYSGPRVTLKKCLLLDEHSSGTDLDQADDGKVDHDKFLLTILERILSKTPWRFGTVHVIEQDTRVKIDELIAIFKMAPVNNSWHGEREEEFEEYAYQYEYD